jgi:glycosyltransferase involved in cell wall biosynthesis
MPFPILFTIPNFITAGSGREMLNIIERLDRKQFEPAVCVMRKGGDLDREVERLGIPLIEAPFAVPARPYHTLPLRAWKAARVFRPYRFALWHSFHYSDDYSEPIIAQMAGTRGWLYTKKNMSWGSRAWRLRSYLARRIVARNNEMLTRFFSGQEHKVRLIPGGVDIRKFKANGTESRLRSAWQFPERTIVIGHVGQLVPVKNHPHLLLALARTKSDVRLVLAGDFLDASYTADVRALVQELRLQDRVRFLGKVRDIPAFLRALDIFAFCSHSEACPVALLEAMAHGLPCVVTDIPAMSDIHIAGQTALVVPKDDVNAFAAALDALAADVEKRRRLGDAARKHIEERFTVEREATAHQQVYFEMLSKPGERVLAAS